MIFTVTKKARPKQSVDMNFKAWDNNAATYGLPFRLLLVLKVCGRLWARTTSGRGHPRGVFYASGGSVHRLAGPGMKEGCSGENVLERER